jgi:hypothetical protein
MSPAPAATPRFAMGIAKGGGAGRRAGVWADGLFPVRAEIRWQREADLGRVDVPSCTGGGGVARPAQRADEIPLEKTFLYL